MRSAVIAAIITIVALITGIAIYHRVSENQAQKRRDKFQRDSFNGLLPPIPGPYLTLGKASELNFTIVDFGHGGILALSEQGKVLTVTRGGSNEGFGDYELLTRDPDQKKSFKNAAQVLMTPKGDCYVFRTKEPNDANAWIEMPDGTTKSLNEISSVNNLWRHGGNHTLGTEAFIFFDENITKREHPFEYYDLTLTKRTATINEPITYIEQAHSSELGDICSGYEESMGGHNAYNLGFFKDGVVTAENIPMPHEYFHIKASKDKVAVTAGSDFFERIPYLRTGKGQYERIGVPKGATSAEVMAMNSHGEYLLSYEVPNHTRPRGVFHADIISCFVSKGKYYLVDDILKHFFPEIKMKGELLNMIDEHGDLVAWWKGHSYLLMRQ